MLLVLQYCYYLRYQEVFFFKLVSDRRERRIDISKLDEDQNSLFPIKIHIDL